MANDHHMQIPATLAQTLLTAALITLVGCRWRRRFTFLQPGSVALLLLFTMHPSSDAALLSGGVLDDDQTSISYYADTGEFGWDAPRDNSFTGINIDSKSGIFGTGTYEVIFGPCDAGFQAPPFPKCMNSPNNFWKASFSGYFDSGTADSEYGVNLVASGLTEEFLLNDLTVVGSLVGGLILSDVDLVYIVPTELMPGDVNQDLSFDQLDLVQVLQANKYLTGNGATWGEGDWNGAPGGSQGNSPDGDGLFDQKDIVAALQAGDYLTGPYAALKIGGVEDDEQTSLVYDVTTGELTLDAPASTNLIIFSIDSAGGKFMGDKPPSLDGAFDNFTAHNLFKSVFGGGGFGDISFGNVLPAGLSEADVAADLTALGELLGGPEIGEVDLVYIPEPSTLFLITLAAVGLFFGVQHNQHRPENQS